MLLELHFLPHLLRSLELHCLHRLLWTFEQLLMCR